MIALLGDLKGVKYLIDSNQIGVLRNRISLINEIFAKKFLEEKKRSRSLQCTTFSDSILGIWESDIEGEEYALRFAQNIWQEINKNEFPYRIFIDGGDFFNDSDSLSNILAKEDNRFHKIFPVAISIWSVFLAESSKFPEGVFIGTKIYNNQKRIDNVIYKAGEFEYFRIC